MYTLTYTSQFSKDLKLAAKRGYNIRLLELVIEKLILTGKLDEKYLSHKLKGDYSDCMECHIKPDWLLIWKQDNEAKR